MLAKRFGACIYLAGFLLIVVRFAAADNTRDTVIMKNGDHFTCNVKKLGNGILYVDVDYVSGPLAWTGRR